jgi:hypothetical protein
MWLVRCARRMVSWRNIFSKSVHVATYWIYTFNSIERQKIWMLWNTDLLTSKSTFYLRFSSLRLAENGIKKWTEKRSAKNRRSITWKIRVIRAAWRQERQRRRKGKEHFSWHSPWYADSPPRLQSFCNGDRQPDRHKDDETRWRARRGRNV